MTEDRTAAIQALLRDTEAAHAVYERDELGGVYDQDWPAWYAQYAVEHGLGDIFGRPIAAQELGEYLARTWDAVRASGEQPGEPWSTWMARRIAADL